MAKSVSKMKFEGQHSDEELLMFFRKHPVVMRKGFIALLACLLISTAPIWIKDTPRYADLWPMLIGLAVGLIILFYYWIAWYYSVYFVTDQRLIQISHKGLFKRSEVDVGLNKIQSVNYQVSGLQETLFGFGTIVAQTYIGDLVMDKIHRPRKIQQGLVSIIKQYGDDSFVEEIT